MKTFKTFAFGVLLTACYLYAPAQNAGVPLNEPNYNKPQIFSDLPQKMTLRITELEGLFNLASGASVSLMVTDQFRLQGAVVSKSSDTDASLKSVVVRSTNRIGCVFTFTKLTDSNGNISYIGRMISAQHGDTFEIIKENGQYVLSKTGFYDLLNE